MHRFTLVGVGTLPGGRILGGRFYEGGVQGDLFTLGEFYLDGVTMEA